MITMSHRVEHGIDIVGFHGRLSAADAGKISDDLHRVLETGNKNISIDMSELDFVDSSGLSVLISTLKFARSEGGDLVLLNVNPRVMALLELTRLNEIIDIYDDQESLINAFKQSSG